MNRDETEVQHTFMAFSKMGFGVGKSRAFDFEKAMNIPCQPLDTPLVLRIIRATTDLEKR